MSSATFFAKLDPRETAIAALVGELHRSEALAAELFASHARLALATVEAEGAMGLSAVSTQTVFDGIAESVRRTADVRGELVALHRRLEKLGKLLGIDVAMYGDGGKTPDDPKKGFFTTGADTSQVS